MKANNRRSLLPQPNSRSFEPAPQALISVSEQEERDSVKAKRGSVLYTRPEQSSTRNNDGTASSTVRSNARTRTDSVDASDNSIQPILSTAGLHKRSMSIKSSANHVKHGSQSATVTSSTNMASRELKGPARTSRLVRTGTLSGSRPNVDAKIQAHKAESRAGTSSQQLQSSPVKQALAKTSTGIARNGSLIAREDSTPTNDTFRAQIELFQLSLLHEQACTALASYQASARRSLGERHTHLREMLREIIGLEARRTREVNLDALCKWLPDPAELLDKLQLVSSIYHETLAFTNDDSSFSATMLAFQDWVLNAEERLSDEGAQGVDKLPEQWRHAHASTALRVRSLQRQLTQLPVPEQSSLALLMKACAALLDATLRELDMMSKLELTLLDMDRVRIDKAIAASGLHDGVLGLSQQAPTSWQTA